MRCTVQVGATMHSEAGILPDERLLAQLNPGRRAADERMRAEVDRQRSARGAAE